MNTDRMYFVVQGDPNKQRLAFFEPIALFKFSSKQFFNFRQRGQSSNICRATLSLGVKLCRIFENYVEYSKTMSNIRKLCRIFKNYLFPIINNAEREKKICLEIK